MDSLQSLSLHDLLIFSPESYFQIFKLSNQALWPFQFPILLCVFGGLFLIYKQYTYSHRIIFAWLTCVWSFVAYWYFIKHYGQISTHANGVAYVYYIQAFLFFCFASFSKMEVRTLGTRAIEKTRYILGGSFIIYGLTIHPIASLSIWKQSMKHIELFSIAPDPTAIATIGFIILLPVKGYFLLLLIPFLSLLLSVLTFQAF